MSGPIRQRPDNVNVTGCSRVVLNGLAIVGAIATLVSLARWSNNEVIKERERRDAEPGPLNGWTDANRWE